jgi:hypothetical protein
MTVAFLWRCKIPTTRFKNSKIRVEHLLAGSPLFFEGQKEWDEQWVVTPLSFSNLSQKLVYIFTMSILHPWRWASISIVIYLLLSFYMWLIYSYLWRKVMLVNVYEYYKVWTCCILWLFVLFDNVKKNENSSIYCLFLSCSVMDE